MKAKIRMRAEFANYQNTKKISKKSMLSTLKKKRSQNPKKIIETPNPPIK
jgi:hypothetical protein